MLHVSPTLPADRGRGEGPPRLVSRPNRRTARSIELPNVRTLTPEQFRYADRLARWDAALRAGRLLRFPIIENPHRSRRPDISRLQLAADDLRWFRTTFEDTQMSRETIAHWSRSCIKNGRPDIARSYFETPRLPFP